MSTRLFVPKDHDIRRALRLRLELNFPDALVLDELAIKHGDYRVDLAVVGDVLHGYEIKSDADTLKRLPDQSKHFSLVFHRMTLVVGPEYLADALAIIPKWWGITLAVRDGFGGVSLSEARPPAENPKMNYRWVARLLWRAELVGMLRSRGDKAGALKKLKYWQVANRCLEVFTPEELTASVTHHLRLRKGAPEPAGDEDDGAAYEQTDNSTWD